MEILWKHLTLNFYKWGILNAESRYPVIFHTYSKLRAKNGGGNPSQIAVSAEKDSAKRPLEKGK